MEITKNLLDQDIATLKKMLPNIECPICHNSNFLVVDGFISNGIQKNSNSIIIGRESIPAVTLICDKCGFISQHAIGIIRENSKKQDG